ncbi:hypothetical protein DXG03_009739 [Asterophora parasitica]|uniref:Uncharacterized protein n=1 Tax=Asterophora parasitica TaxID=117018 RepID=A0A9P7FX77_9AGAR|nr:hypothetical protein DXG03_009739 [Asterophora parasitica]
MGACIALQTGVSYPDKVLSLFLVSPLPLQEPQEVREGRQEIFDCWAEGWRNYPDVDESAFMDALLGLSQLGYNNVRTTLSDVLNEYSLPRAMRNFNRDRLEEFHTASVKFFVDRVPHSLEKLSRVKCPVQLVQCGGDIAYPISFAQELLQRLLDAGVDAELDVIEDAPHFGTVTHYEDINPLLHNFIISHTIDVVPPAPKVVTSPFEAYLVSLGWTPGTDETDIDDEYTYDFAAALPWAYPPPS